MYDVAVVYVNYYSGDVLEKSINSLYRALKYFDLSFAGKKTGIFIGNNSPEENLQNIAENFPGAVIIENGKNLGFGRAINKILRDVEAEYALFLNPDTELSENFVYTLYSFLRSNRDYGLAYSLIKNTNNTVQPASLRDTPEIMPAIFRLLGLSKLFAKSRFFNSYHKGYEGYFTEQDADTCSGSCMMIRMEAYKRVGGFDERFFLYGEDLDIARMLRKSGYRIRYIPGCHVLHIKNYSSKDRWFIPLFHFYYSMLLYLIKYSGGVWGYISIFFGFFFILFLFIIKVFYNIIFRLLFAVRRLV